MAKRGVERSVSCASFCPRGLQELFFRDAFIFGVNFSPDGRRLQNIVQFYVHSPGTFDKDLFGEGISLILE